MTSLYGMIACGLGFAVFAAIYFKPTDIKSLPATNTNQPGNAGLLGKSPVDFLIEETTNYSDSLRRFQANFDLQAEQISQADRLAMRAAGTDQEKRDAFGKTVDSTLRQSAVYGAEFEQNYRRRALRLQGDLVDALKSCGILPPYDPSLPLRFHSAEFALQYNTLAGSRPVLDIAAYLDFLARKLETASAKAHSR